jgi:hypothetical protein
MRKGTVTGEIKSILKELNVEYNGCYSDTYRFVEGGRWNNRRVGVKFIGVFLTPEQTELVKIKMENKGFKFDFIRENKGKSYYNTNGTRFCFKY